MSFLNSKVTDEQEQLVTDLYTVFKCEKSQHILAENLQNILIVIDGERYKEIEVADGSKSESWEQAGLYDQETGMFYLREKDHVLLQAHFKPLRMNRL